MVHFVILVDNAKFQIKWIFNMKTEEKVYRIGEIAEMFDLSKSTIRFYEEIGLFPNLKRSPGGLRLFSQEEINCIEDVECLKKTGMSLKDIAAYVSWKQEGDSSLLARLNLIRNQRLTLEQNIRNLEKELIHRIEKELQGKPLRDEIYSDCQMKSDNKENILSCTLCWPAKKILYFCSSQTSGYHMACQFQEWHCFWGGDPDFPLEEFIRRIAE